MRSYSFNLNWEDLPEELRNEKIDEYLESSKENGDTEMTREMAEEYIESHFPIYF